MRVAVDLATLRAEGPPGKGTVVHWSDDGTMWAIRWDSEGWTPAGHVTIYTTPLVDRTDDGKALLRVVLCEQKKVAL